MSYEDRGRDGKDVATSPGRPGATRSSMREKMESAPRAFRGSTTLLRPPASRTVRG